MASLATPTDKILLKSYTRRPSQHPCNGQLDGTWSVAIAAAPGPTAYDMVITVDGVELATANRVYIGESPSVRAVLVALMPRMLCTAA